MEPFRQKMFFYGIVKHLYFEECIAYKINLTLKEKEDKQNPLK